MVSDAQSLQVITYQSEIGSLADRLDVVDMCCCGQPIDGEAHPAKRLFGDDDLPKLPPHRVVATGSGTGSIAVILPIGELIGAGCGWLVMGWSMDRRLRWHPIYSPDREGGGGRAGDETRSAMVPIHPQAYRRAMTEISPIGIKDRLWHAARADLSNYAPDMPSDLLMCCCCGRWMPQSDFSLEHIIPQQLVKRDPIEVRQNKATPVNVRSGNLLLCTKALLFKGRQVHGLGCNSWKGTYFDKPIAQMFSSLNLRFDRRSTAHHIVAGLVLAYLAAVREYGYRIVLMKSGLLMREQFFNPLWLLRSIPVDCQMMLGGDPTAPPPDAESWAKPFAFEIEDNRCLVTSRNFGFALPISDDPTRFLAKRIKYVPARFKLRPDFSTFFD